MSLFLAGTWNQALLASVVAEARLVADAKDSYVGRTALQKIMYFLKVSGVPMGYHFEIHNFGPFCQEILSDMDVLIADEVVEDTSGNPNRYSNYTPSKTLEELLALHQADLAPQHQRIKTVVMALVPLSPDRLELLATLDFAYRWIKASGGKGPWKNRVVERFIEIKKEKFKRQEVERTYDQMASAGLLEQ